MFGPASECYLILVLPNIPTFCTLRHFRINYSHHRGSTEKKDCNLSDLIQSTFLICVANGASFHEMFTRSSAVGAKTRNTRFPQNGNEPFSSVAFWQTMTRNIRTDKHSKVT